ncbi:o-succinylbenzoate--CoA ligase [Staphylococcus sp. 17KM0847]|uniref:o-succinylbenzoate--CoA ligase n=1 Tax=Staphylococcus sp. 17KM0847 TaxID=2583989 RepID=UPI0015DC6F68|nr:o-succinylbenzoate--CoA ligase [Staphylococcus sp. 17KM0847]QLK86321.1 o-succinylbenzoate--CoA ligase [Staphylococcus sp. 17KM0847]
MEHWLVKQVQQQPEAIAIETASRRLTFQQLYVLAQNYGTRLKALKDRRIGLLVDNSVEALALIHGAWLYGIEIALINNRLTDEEIRAQMQSIHVRTVVVTERYRLRCHQIQMTHLTCITCDDIPFVHRLIPSTTFHETDIASIMFTSGTTGSQKAVPQTFKNHRASAESCKVSLGFDKTSRWLVVLPIYHISGLSIVIRSVLYGFTLFLMDKFDEVRVLNALQQQHITHISLVPLTLQRLMYAGLTKPYHLEKVLLGGAKLEKKFVEQALSYHLPIYNSFGMTETCSQFLTAHPNMLASHPETVGRVSQHNQLKVIAPNAQGHGELCVRGDNVMNGYLYPSDVPGCFDAEGYFKTGDIASIDHQGYVVIHDRRKDLIISGGENIYPNEIERIAKQHPAVIDAMCVGIYDEYWGQRPFLYLVAQECIEDIWEFLSERLAKYKLPVDIQYVTKLPYTSTGKLKRQLLNGD